MKSESKKSAPESLNSLEDSVFEVISNDHSFLASDDEDAHTESLASTDGYTCDDAFSVGVADDMGEEEMFADDSSNSEDEGFDTLQASGATGIVSQSVLTSRTTACDDMTTRPTISNQKELGSQAVPGIRNESWEVETFDQSNMPSVYRQYQMPSLRILGHFARSDQLLHLTSSFRIWYFGDPDHKAEILDKIGSALYVGKGFSHGSHASSGAAARYNVTPISSFTREVAVLPSSGIDMDITECTIQCADREEVLDRPSVKLLLDNKLEVDIKNNAIRVRPSELLDDFWIPDLAVFCHIPSHQCMDESYAHIPLSIARDAIKLLEIPILDVNSEFLLPKSFEDLTFEPKSLHMSLEGESSPEAETQTIAVYPIPLEIFRELDSTLLNQHLHYLTTAQIQPRSGNALYCSFRNLFTYEKSGWRWLPRAVYQKIPMYVIATMIVPFLVFWIFANPLSLSRLQTLVENNLTVMAPDTSSTLSIMTQPSPTRELKASYHDASMTLSISDAERSVSTVRAEKSLGQPLLPSFLTKSNQNPQFRTNITGDHHITITPPTYFVELRRPPRIVISVSRGNDIIPAKIKELPNLQHLVTIPRSEAFGSLQVIVSTTTKPLLNQASAIHFERSWLSAYSTNSLSRLAELLGCYDLLEMTQARTEGTPSNSTVSGAPVALAQSVIDRIGRLAKAEALSWQARGGIASAEARRLVTFAAQTVSVAARSTTHQIQGVVAHVESLDLARFWSVRLPVDSSSALLDARHRARRIFKKIRNTK